MGDVPEIINKEEIFMATAVKGKRPDWIKKEKMELPQEESIFPSIGIIHDLSPQNDPQSQDFIKGAKTGMLFNSATKALYNGTTGIRVQVLMVTKQWIEWTPRDQGGGFVRSYNSKEEAENGVTSGNELRASISYYVRLVDEEGEDGNPPIAVIRFGTPSKMKVARKWNFLIEESQSVPGMIYKVAAVMEANKKKQRYYNFGIEPLEWASKLLYSSANQARIDLEKGQLQISGSTEVSF